MKSLNITLYTVIMQSESFEMEMIVALSKIFLYFSLQIWYIQQI